MSPSETKSLFEKALGLKEFWLVNGTKHEDLLDHALAEYLEQVSNFIERQSLLMLMSS